MRDIAAATSIEGSPARRSLPDLLSLFSCQGAVPGTGGAGATFQFEASPTRCQPHRFRGGVPVGGSRRPESRTRNRMIPGPGEGVKRRSDWLWRGPGTSHRRSRGAAPATSRPRRVASSRPRRAGAGPRPAAVPAVRSGCSPRGG